MNYKKIGFYIFLVLSSLKITAQQTVVYTHHLKAYYQAIDLYNDKAYAAAQNRFNTLSENFPAASEKKALCAYYAANCAIRLGQRDGDKLMQAFVDTYPTSTKRNDAFIDVSEYYYKNGRYAYALKWFKRIKASKLTQKQSEDFNFKYGYSLFATKNYAASKPYFTKLLDSPKYGAKAKYYYGYMAYSEDDFETADTYLNDAKEGDASYQKNISYYLADINFKLGKFQKALDEALPLYEKANRKDKSEIAKIIGESYFNLKDYQKAIPYLKAYKGKRGKWNNTDYYLLGYSYYMQKDYPNAIASFNKIISGQNAVAQNAYYHLAKCYLELGKKTEALNAFRNASQMDFEKDLQEDAWLNYAKLSYEIGNPYKSVPEVLKEFINNYPKSTHTNEINNLIISAYMTSNDYQGALDYVKEKKTSEERAVYQKAAFFRGVQLFNDKNFKDAQQHFEKSLSEKIDSDLAARALYWKGESNYQLNNYQAALDDYQQFSTTNGANTTSEYNNLQYNIAYAYFKQKKYQQAINAFLQYGNNQQNNAVKRTDSYLRLADSYFVTSSYQNAINAYSKAIEIGKVERDYAHFQKAISFGYIGKENDKKQALKEFLNTFKKSKYRDDAYYVLANAYVKTGDDTQAHENFDILIQNHSRSILLPKAYLKKGLLYNNNNKTEQALTAYKTIVEKYPNTPEARQAVKNARQIYVDSGRVDEYAAWVKGIDFINVTDADLDNDTYEAAETQYIQNNPKKAIIGFKKYLRNFSNGLHALQANFYLAQALYATGKQQETIPYFENIVQRDSNEFTEISLERLSNIYLTTKNWSKAIPLLERLENEANHEENVTYAQSNLMKAYYHEDKYNKAVSYAEKVLQNGKIDNKIRSDAKIIIARSAIKTGDINKAKLAYQEVAYIATGILKAEALYYSAYFDYEAKNYLQSKQTVEKIAANYASYKYWGGKSLIIMAKDYDALDDAFQATYILESVIKNFAEFEEITTEAKTELNHIKTEEAKTNYSVNPNE